MVFLDDKIRIQRVLKDKLISNKLFERETVNSVITRMIFGTTFIPACEKCGKEAHLKLSTPDGIAYFCSEKHVKETVALRRYCDDEDCLETETI